MKIYSIGHSTRSLEEFVDILKNFNIELVIDIRRFPSSKKFPHFNKDILEKELVSSGIEYLHFPELGGFRKGGYIAFMQTEDFKSSLEKLIQILDNKIPAVMCAESKWFRCHRRFVCDELRARGNEITHIHNKEKIEKHKTFPQTDLKIFCDK